MMIGKAEHLHDVPPFFCFYPPYFLSLFLSNNQSLTRLIMKNEGKVYDRIKEIADKQYEKKELAFTGLLQAIIWQIYCE